MEGGSLVLFIMGDVGGLDGTFSLSLGGADLCSVKLELVCVESDLFGFFLDLYINVDLALIGPRSELKVEEGEVVVDGFDAVQESYQPTSCACYMA